MFLHRRWEYVTLIWIDTCGRLWVIWSQTIGDWFDENMTSFAIIIENPDADIYKISYPDAFEDENGCIYVVYDRGRKTDREILMAVFNEEDIKAGEFTSSCSGKYVISKP
jgi:hypothetical protein